MDGVELAKQIRESSDIPIIMYTGKGSEEVASRAFSVGVDDYIRKEMDPSHYEVLARRIRAAVGAHRSEKSLHKRDQELSSMIENSIDGIFRVEMARGITRCNPAFLKLFGYSIEELQSMGMGMLELIHDEDKAQFRSELDDLSSRKLKSYTSLNRWFTKSGEVIWLDSSITALVQNEKFIGVEIIARDVTERKEYVNRLESIYQHASNLSQSQTLKEIAKATLNGIEETFGFKQMSFTEIQGNVIKGNSPPVRTVFPLDGEGIIAKVARTGKTINLSDIRDNSDYFEAVPSTRSELTVPINVDGKIVAVINIESSKANAFSSEDQRLVEIFSEQIASTMRWLTQLERVQSSEEREREREQRLTEAEIRDLARFPSENINPVMRISGDGVIIYANPASESLLRDWNTVESGKVPKEWRKIIKGALKSGKNEESEIILRDRVFSFNISPITEAGYVNIYGRDITKQKLT
jgi:PAS domain S-box-containing protein